jgi:hypothetical protein
MWCEGIGHQAARRAVNTSKAMACEAATKTVFFTLSGAATVMASP